jgi:hypothetical protein
LLYVAVFGNATPMLSKDFYGICVFGTILRIQMRLFP